jgi:ketosteroid isomerase-like protein
MPSPFRADKTVAALLLAALVLTACATKNDTKADRLRVEARLQVYSARLLAMDPAGIAALFAPGGEMVNPRQPPVHGREAIAKFLAGFADYKVLSNVDEASSTAIDGDTAEQLGTYRQQVRSPDGRLFDASGRFEIGWLRNAAGEWEILQLETFPSK